MEMCARRFPAVVMSVFPAVAQHVLRHALSISGGEEDALAWNFDGIGQRKMRGIHDKDDILPGIFLQEGTHVRPLRPVPEQRALRMPHEIEGLVQAEARSELKGHPQRVAKTLELLQAGAGEMRIFRRGVDGRRHLPGGEHGIPRRRAADFPGSFHQYAEELRVCGGVAPGIRETGIGRFLNRQRFRLQQPDHLGFYRAFLLADHRLHAVILILIGALQCRDAGSGGVDGIPAFRQRFGAVQPKAREEHAHIRLEIRCQRHCAAAKCYLTHPHAAQSAQVAVFNE
ncbi:MAG: hypothetical protein BWY76_01926 [bacterium ADurb.Bin429]|nr:MAG: hypothetical protein BWY76_01926 [bacterium ADurb.Bin429]